MPNSDRQFYSVALCVLYVTLVLNWHKVLQTEDDEGSLVSEASGLLQYQVTKEAVGKFLSFKCIPIRNDGILGEPRVFTGKDRVTPGVLFSLFA